MIRKLIAILMLSTPGFAVCTSQAGGGNWDSSIAIWSCNHIPTTTDSVVIAAGNNITVENGLTTANVTGITFSGTNATLTVQAGATLNWATMTINATGAMLDCQPGSTCNFGSNTATSTTLDGTITLGTFNLEPGATMTFTGSIKANGGSALFNGHSICQPATASVFQVLEANNTAADSTLMSFQGSSWTQPAVFETSATPGQTAGNACKVVQTTSSSVPKLVTNFAIFNRCGDATQDCWTFTTQTNPGSMSVQNTLFNNFGRLTIITNSGVGNATTFLWANVDFRNQNAASATPLVLGSTNTTVPSAPRVLQNITCDTEDSTGLGSLVTVNGSNFNIGSSSLFPSSTGQDIAGMNFFNCRFNGIGINNLQENFFVGLDQTTGAGNIVVLFPNILANSVWQNSAFYVRGNNPHLFNSTAASASTMDIWQYNLMDGDMYVPGDSGEVCHSGGTWSCLHNININGNGNLTNTQNPQAISADNNLQWNQASASIGETTANALELTEAYDNLFQCPLCLGDQVTFPATSPTQCTSYNSGINEQNTFTPQTNLNEDNNWKFNFPNEGDPYSQTCTQVVQGGIYPYMGIFAVGNATYRGATAFFNKASTGTTGTGCPAACELDYSVGGFTTGTGDQPVQVNDFVWNVTNSQWTTVKTVVSNTQLILNAGPLASFTIASGNSFTIQKGIWADHSAIGSATNRGLHDVHADARFYSPFVSICTWYNSIGNLLTCPTQITGSGSTDTNIQTIMHQAVTINGWDYGSGTSLLSSDRAVVLTNCTANCPQRVTPWAHTATELLKYMGQHYRVYNGMAKNAGHTGGDVGPAWIPNFPSATMSF
jgi:hypothetical protein